MCPICGVDEMPKYRYMVWRIVVIFVWKWIETCLHLPLAVALPVWSFEVLNASKAIMARFNQTRTDCVNWNLNKRTLTIANRQSKMKQREREREEERERERERERMYEWKNVKVNWVCMRERKREIEQWTLIPFNQPETRFSFDR